MIIVTCQSPCVIEMLPLPESPPAWPGDGVVIATARDDGRDRQVRQDHRHDRHAHDRRVAKER